MSRSRWAAWVAAAVVALVACAGVGEADDGLVAEWHFDEGFGNILSDSSGNGNNGTIHGATWATGIFGSALQFDGVDDYVEVPDSPELSGGAGKNMTVEFWFTSSKHLDMLLQNGRIQVTKIGAQVSDTGGHMV